MNVAVTTDTGMSGAEKAGIAILIIAIIIGILLAVYFLVIKKPRTSSGPSVPLQPSVPTNPNSGLPQTATPWACLQATVQSDQTNTPIQVNPTGDIQCMSSDGQNCLWSANCPTQLTTVPSNLKPVVCAAPQYTQSGHWCNNADKYYKTGPTTP